MHISLSRVYYYDCKITPDSFLTWEENETVKVRFGKGRCEEDWATRMLPRPYIRLICQFQAEDEHGDYDNTYEAQRRQSYARRVLDQLGMELERFNGPGNHFRSKVLTPILQRHVCGVSDSSGLGVYYAIPRPDDDISITHATAFYLRNDPVDPRNAPTLRRNLIYIREARWHLETLIRGNVYGRNLYSATIINQNYLMASLHKAPPQPQAAMSPTNIPPFTKWEVLMILLQEPGLEEFFHEELSAIASVRNISLTPFADSSR